MFIKKNNTIILMIIPYFLHAFHIHLPFLYCHIFFFNDTATTEIYTLSLHDALPIWMRHGQEEAAQQQTRDRGSEQSSHSLHPLDRKSTRLNSSHGYISYAVFCL